MSKNGLELSPIFAVGMEVPNHPPSGTFQDQI